MQLLNSYESHTPANPGKVLAEKYLRPSGMSKAQFGKALGVNVGGLNFVLKGGCISHSVIDRISQLTCTPTRYWYYMQSDWQFFKYTSKNKNNKKIPPIISSRIRDSEEFGSPGHVLLNEYIKPLGRTFSYLNDKMGLNIDTVHEIIHGKRRISYKVAYRLANAFGTDTRYWLDIQSSHELRLILKENKFINSQIAQSIRQYCKRTLYRGNNIKIPKRKYLHPGRVLFKEYIKPSKISILEWQRLLCVSNRFFKNIIAGRSEMPLGLIVKFCKILGTKVEYWIEMQNNYYASKGEKELSRKKTKIERNGLALSFHKEVHISPFEMLSLHFLKPMGITRRDFMNHIGLDKDQFERIQKEKMKISYKLAIQMGEAFGVDPLFWVRLQLERDIYRYESNKEG